MAPFCSKAEKHQVSYHYYKKSPPNRSAQCRAKQNKKAECKESVVKELLFFSIFFLQMISISKTPCFASRLQACVYAITALQVVACPAGGVKKLPVCVLIHSMCVWGECYYCKDKSAVIWPYRKLKLRDDDDFNRSTL